jgi:hypothetical protein
VTPTGGGTRSGACTSGSRAGRSGGSRPDGPARKAGWLRTLTDAAITTLLNRVQTTPSSFSGIGLQHMGGAAARIAPMGTAFAHRADQYDVLILSRWADPAESQRNIAWTRETFAAMEPRLTNAVYVNNPGEEG